MGTVCFGDPFKVAGMACNTMSLFITPSEYPSTGRRIAILGAMAAEYRR